MMKSFFKKLAFVMALAMVVSVMAPAGSAFAAEATVALKDKTAVTEHALAVGAEEDYCFLGAPKNWKELGWKWTSSNPEVATVDEVTGLTKGVADGVATITVTVGDEYTAAVVVTVGAGEVVDNSYTYKQTTHKQATFTFAQDVNYTVADVELVKVFAGGYEVSWPIETFKCEKNVVTVEPYVAFADGDEYIIKIGAEDEGTTFKTTLGAVDYIEVAYKSLDKEGVAYAKLNEDDEDIEVELSVKLFSNGVDVTKAEGYDLENVEFELLTTSNNYDIDEDILIFEKYGEAATVKVTYTGADDKKQENITTIISQPAPKYTIVSVDKWTLVDTNKTNLEIDWTKSMMHSVPAFDDNYTAYGVVVLMTDSYGNKIVYPSEFAAKSKAINNVPVLSLDALKNYGTETYIEAAEDFEIRFSSTNANKIFVGVADGLITTLGESQAPILVSLYDENNDGDTVLVKNLYAAGLNVTAERVPSKITANVEFGKLLVDVYNVVDAAYETGNVKFTVVDQYGDPVRGIAVNVSESDDKVSVSGSATTSTADWNAGQATVTLNGEKFKYENSKGKTVAVDSLKLTAKLPYPYNNVSTTFTVKTGAPEVIVSKDGKTATLVVEGYEVAAASKDMKVAKLEDNATATVTTDVVVYETSNGLRVGVADEVVLLTKNDTYKGETVLKDGKGAFSIKSGVASAGALFAVVYDKNGEAVTEKTGSAVKGITEVAGGKYTVTAVAPKTQNQKKPVTGSSLDIQDYMTAGEYTVKLFEVAKNYTDTTKNAKLNEVSTTFTLSNSSAKVTVKEQDYIDLPANEKVAVDFEDVLFTAFDFKLGSANLDEEYAKIVAASTKYNESSNYLYIYNVTFAVPLNNGSDDVYYTYKVTINKSVKVGDEYDHSTADIKFE